MVSEHETSLHKLSNKEKIQKRIKETIEPAFSNGAKLFHDAINFWTDLNTDYLKYLSPEKLKNHFDSLQPLPHYEQGYLNKGENDIKTALEYDDKEGAEFIKMSYPEETKKIMELSNPEQVVKYNQLVDEFNKMLPQIKQTMDLQILKNFYQKAKQIIYEKK